MPTAKHTMIRTSLQLSRCTLTPFVFTLMQSLLIQLGMLSISISTTQSPYQTRKHRATDVLALKHARMLSGTLFLHR